MAECPKCQRRWFIYNRAMLVSVVELGRESELAAEQTLVLDNLGGVSTLNRTRTVNYEWSKSLSMSVEGTQTEETGFEVGKKDVATLSSMASNAVKTTYQVTQEERKTYTEELSFEVPPGIRRDVTLTFRRIWQLGIVKMSDEAGDPVDIPYRVAVELEMDVAQSDTGLPTRPQPTA